VLADPAAAVARALAEPVGVPALPALARGRRSACILICDITRPVPNGLFLGPLVRGLLDAGVPRAGITVLVATGLHRANEGAELAELVGDPWVLETVSVANHDATVDRDHVLLGRTPGRGTVVRLDRRLMAADLKIATGLVEPHFMAGWSGGRKVIAPGVAHAETITTFHNSAFMAHPRAANCVLDGNPLHEEQLAIVGMLGGALALNTVIDDRRRLAFVNFGEIVASHLEAVAFARRYAQVAVHRRFHTVVTSAAGYPLDKTYYQTVKGMVGPLDILEPGGDLIVASACSEGMGSKHYVEAQRRLVDLGPDGFAASIERKPHADIDEWQTQMQLRPMRVGRVRLYTDGLDATAAGLTGVERVSDLAGAVAESMARHRNPHVAFVPEGPYVVPVHEEA
jgi:nickel-dependent lactate racemase